MKREEQLHNVARNLQSLCRTFRSVAEACRVLGVNRQQFNKYLAGKHVPASKVLASVARHFSIGADDFFASEAQFEVILNGPHAELAREMQLSPEFQRFAPFITGSRELLRPYCGVYYRYHNSSIYKGQILRSILCIYEHHSTTQYVCVERFPRRDGSGKIEYLFKYHGFALMVGDRIFLIDCEGLQRNELTFSILLPRHRNVLRFLYGIVSGVASTALREPFSTRMILDYQGQGQIAKKHLARATALLPSDKTIPLEARTYLTGKNSTIIWGGGP
jgi:transcriptional regulator with XRE-family HTH domain